MGEERFISERLVCPNCGGEDWDWSGDLEGDAPDSVQRICADCYNVMREQQTYEVDGKRVTYWAGTWEEVKA